jgi:hypothetical protein
MFVGCLCIIISGVALSAFLDKGHFELFFAFALNFVVGVLYLSKVISCNCIASPRRRRRNPLSTTERCDLSVAIAVYALLIGLAFYCVTESKAATTFTEWYVQNTGGGLTGDNLNAGSTTNNAAVLTYAGGTFVRSTGVFTVASGNPVSDPVPLGAWASIYTTAGATVATFVAMVTGTNATTITVSLTAIAGAASTVSESAAAATCKIGGAWLGPNGTVGFPFNFVTATLTNASGVAIGYAPRVNFLTGTYTVTAAITHSLAGPIRWQGYSVTPGDMLAKATITDSATAASYVLFTCSGANNDFADFIFSSSFSSGTSDGVSFAASVTVSRCVAHDFRRAGFVAASAVVFSECEAYLCNKANSSGYGGFNTTTGSSLIRCISHDNAGSNACGFVLTNPNILMFCIADSNGAHGFLAPSGAGLQVMIGCDAYNNTGAGLYLASTAIECVVLQNCNFIKNGVWGINLAGGAGTRNGNVINCGFGAGTQANGTGTIAGIGSLNEVGSITYAANVTPWIDPANGDFRINLAAAKGTGRGTFTETQASYAGTVSYPDVGAGQGTSVQNASGGSYPFAQ